MATPCCHFDIKMATVCCHSWKGVMKRIKRVMIEFSEAVPEDRAENLLGDLQAQCEEDEDGESYGGFIIEVEDAQGQIETWTDLRNWIS